MTSFTGAGPITADTALRVGQALGMTPEFWLNLQRMYDLDLARALDRHQRHRTPRRSILNRVGLPALIFQEC